MNPRNLLYFLFFFIIFYLENITLGGIKFSIIWKIPLFAVMIYYLINATSSRTKPRYINSGFYFAFSKFLGSGIAFVQFIKDINIVLFGMFFRKYLTDVNHVKKLLFFLAIFSIISFIPFDLGIIEPIGDQLETEGFGITEAGKIGIFSNPHQASINLSGSLLICLYFRKFLTKRFNTVLYLLIAYGIYTLLMTYVRTGLLAFLVGCVPVFIQEVKDNRFRRTALILSGLVIVGFIIISSNEGLYNRIFDIRLDSDYVVNQSTIGSGRLIMWKINFEHWVSLSPELKLIGVGEKEALSFMKLKLGYALFSHNGFVDILIRNGIIGLLLFLFFLHKIYSEIRSNHLHNYLSLGLFGSYIIILFFQGGTYFLFEILLVLSIEMGFQERINSVNAIAD